MNKVVYNYQVGIRTKYVRPMSFPYPSHSQLPCANLKSSTLPAGRAIFRNRRPSSKFIVYVSQRGNCKCVGLMYSGEDMIFKLKLRRRKYALILTRALSQPRTCHIRDRCRRIQAPRCDAASVIGLLFLCRTPMYKLEARIKVSSHSEQTPAFSDAVLYPKE